MQPDVDLLPIVLRPALAVGIDNTERQRRKCEHKPTSSESASGCGIASGWKRTPLD